MNNNVINEIRSKVDIVDVISSYIPLIQKGKNYWAVCPFHDDTRPSMSVSKSLQMYKCFSCGNAGNVFNFIMEYEHVDFKEALKILSNKTGVSINGLSLPKESNKFDQLYKLNDFANSYFKNNLNSKEGLKAKEYLSKRKLTEEIIREFEIGLSLNDKSNLTKLLLGKGYTIDQLNNMDLSTDDRDTFINRIIFPIHDYNGKIIGFSGRIYDNSTLNKYQNTKQTPIFKKGQIIYNYHRAKEIVRTLKSVVVMEGFMAVIRASSVGINNCIALMGTSMTSDQAIAIKKLSHDIILCFDGDDAGQQATLVNGEHLVKMGLKPKVIVLEDKLDPDDYIIKYGKERFQILIDTAIDFNEYKLRVLKSHSDLATEQGKTDYLNSVLLELSKSNDPIKSELVLKKLAKEFNIWYNTLDKKLSNLLKEQKGPENNSFIIPYPDRKFTKYDKATLSILYLMLTSNNLIKIVDEEKIYLPRENARFLMNEIIFYYRKNGMINIADFYTYLHDKKELLDLLNEIVSLKLPDEKDGESIYDYIKTIKEYNIGLEVKRLENLMKNEPDDLCKAKISEKIRMLKQEKEANN